jgi:hypothetical protein
MLSWSKAKINHSLYVYLQQMVLNNNHSFTPMIIYNRSWVGAKHNHSLQWLFTTYVELALINNQSLTLWLFTTDVELALSHNLSLTPMIIYNRC